ncbi:MAG: hypothetical protein V3V08_19680 [Nannocystaceae bacterium]
MNHSRRGSGGRPLRPYISGLVVVLVIAGAVGALDWDLSVLLDAESRTQAALRVSRFVGAFGAPDLSNEALLQGASLSVQTLSVALLGSALGIVMGYVLALGASRIVMVGSDTTRRVARTGSLLNLASHLARRVALEGCRMLLDTLRGVPDFAWAVLILTIPGPGPVTGMLALGLSVAGMLGKVYSELWDSVDPQRYAAVSQQGGRLITLFYGVQPLSGRSMLSYTLMRTECCVRNASVIGVVGGGGLGGQLFDEFAFGNYERVVTLLIFLLLLTGGVDLLSNWLRYRLRAEHTGSRMGVQRAAGLRIGALRRLEVLGIVLVALAGSLWWLRDGLARSLSELQRIEWTWIGEQVGELLRPDLSPGTLAEASLSAVVPVAMGILSTVGACLIAAALVFPSSILFQRHAHLFTGEDPGRARRMIRIGSVVVARGTALVLRGMPDVAWVLLLASFFRLGVLAGVAAIALHSSGVLARVFVEVVDNIPARRLEPLHIVSRTLTFVYAALPIAGRDWRTYGLFQFESNVRAGVVLGIVGVGGWGTRFTPVLAIGTCRVRVHF